MNKLKKIIKHYGKHQLDKKSLKLDPIEQFDCWMQDAIETEPREPNAMILSTVADTGQPSARIMLLKEYDKKGFVFFTNYESKKGQELSKNRQVALTFWWPYCERQVRIEGRVEKISSTESDDYFASRGLESRIGALASMQSKILSNRAELTARVTAVEKKYGPSEDIPRPNNWGGYRVKPNAIEFWQGRPHRLHDRILFTKQDDGHWEFVRLAP